jgi:hypothetical protein
MAARHDTPEYREARTKWGRVVQYGAAYCHQPVCVMEDRYIEPGSRWDLAHDDTGTLILGPAHARCNRSEAGKKRHRKPRREFAESAWSL